MPRSNLDTSRRARVSMASRVSSRGRCAFSNPNLNNRPNGEVGPDLHSDALATAAKAAGLDYVVNPITPGSFTPELVAAQEQAIKSAKGPVFAYCASGNRSTLAWELVKAPEVAVETLLEIASSHGYSHGPFAPLIASFAKR